MDKENLKTDIRTARRFDDLTVLTDGGAFERSFKEIYPKRNLRRRMI